MKILILYAEVMPYNFPVFQALVAQGYTLHVVQIDKQKLTPYAHTDAHPLITIRNLSTFQHYRAFADYCEACEPGLIMMSEVMERWYWKITRAFHKKKKSLPIVLGSDAQWTGNRNNWLKKSVFPLPIKNHLHTRYWPDRGQPATPQT